MSVLTKQSRARLLTENRPHFVYQFWAEDRCLYVGMTASPSGRIAPHAQTEWWAQVVHFEADVLPDRETARQREADLIRDLQPHHNFQHAEVAAGSRSGRGSGGVAWRKADVTP